MRENLAVRTLLRVLPQDLQPAESGEDVTLRLGYTKLRLRPVWVGDGLPADARRGLEALAFQPADRGDRAIPVIIARRVSPGARQLVEDARVSWADASGRAHIAVPGRLYLSRLDPIPADKPRSFTWSDAASAIAETLLAWRSSQQAPANAPIGRVADIASIADVSLAHTARVLREFDERRYTFKAGAERGSSAIRQLQDPGRLLSDWASQHIARYAPAAALDFHVPWRDPERSLTTLTHAFAGLDWAVTGESAADRITPLLTHTSTVEVYVPDTHIHAMADRLAQQPDVTPVSDGGRIRLLPCAPHVFRLTDEVQHLHMVPLARIYADLLRQGGRFAEAAEHLREVAIGF